MAAGERCSCTAANNCLAYTQDLLVAARDDELRRKCSDAASGGTTQREQLSEGWSLLSPWWVGEDYIFANQPF